MTVIDRLVTVFSADVSGLESGAKKASSAIHGVQSVVGRGSLFKEVFEIAHGAGPLIGLGLAARMFGHLADKAKEAREAGAGWQHVLAESIPIIGTLERGVWDLAEAIDGVKSAQEKDNKIIEKQRDLNRDRERIAGRIAGAGLSEADKKRFDIAEEHKQTLREIAAGEMAALGIGNQGLFRQFQALREKEEQAQRARAHQDNLKHAREVAEEYSKSVKKRMDQARDENERWLKEQEDEWKQFLQDKLSKTDAGRAGPSFAAAAASGSMEAFANIVAQEQEKEQSRRDEEARKQREKIIQELKEMNDEQRNRAVWDVK